MENISFFTISENTTGHRMKDQCGSRHISKDSKPVPDQFTDYRIT